MWWLFFFLSCGQNKKIALILAGPLLQTRGGGANAAKRANGFFVGIGNLTMSKNTIYK